MSHAVSRVQPAWSLPPELPDDGEEEERPAEMDETWDFNYEEQQKSNYDDG